MDGINQVVVELEIMCLNKASFSAKEIDDVLERIISKSGFIWYYYHCDLCGRYHLTTKTPKKNIGVKII